ncbi:MAG TPA: cytochrome-c oxidase, cbb3-type subunit II [Longimicrobiales bacterium]|nr:cytochrome-c oxidase, cbb3-type subunit II [Longimicrobiales bacterium]
MSEDRHTPQDRTPEDAHATGGHQPAKEHWHRRLLEGRIGLFAVLTTVVISIGGIVEIVPMFSVKTGPQPLAGVTPFTPLELAGRDIYIREGCYVCHSQMIRPMRAELQRYGEWTRAGELVYERPFLLGSRRIGPDLQRVGGKYPDAWHYEHMRDPRSTSPGSIMPPYAFLLERRVDPRDVTASLVALRRLGVPYDNATVEQVARHMNAQAASIMRSLAAAQIDTEPDREIIALIAYLQRLGQDGRRALEAAEGTTAAAPTSTAEGGS